ncbi:MAG: CBS domain-containing protein [Labilithrix sp.]|nr:CBS domain-containing protein [Labilithrix sp.]
MEGGPRNDKTSAGELEGPERARYVRALLSDLRALERMLAEGRFEAGISTIGAEQEMFLVDRAYNASPTALELIDKVADPHFTTELGLFNLEMNADPQSLEGGGLARLEAQLTSLYARVQAAAAELHVQPVLAGILPTLARTDLSLDNMVPNPRYLTLNRVMSAAKGDGYDISIKGLDELVAKHDSLMFEACNASFQVHLQSLDPSRFGHDYDVAQLVLAPTLAIGTNSPTLLGKRLWAETRIALFEQSCDIRTRTLHARQDAPRVSFGKGWATRGGALGIFKENVTRFRPLVGMSVDEDSLKVLDEGGVPELRALRLHSGTIYRWNRACYGVSPSGKPHLRIELRALPSGPSIIDEVANAAFWIGLMRELSVTIEDLPSRMDFDQAQANFYNAAREGLAARFIWLDGEEVIAQPFVLDRLLPIAEAGLARAGVEPADAQRYLGVVDKRVRTLHTGSRWALRSLADMKPKGTPGEHLAALVAATIARQDTARPVAEWERARLDEVPARRTGWAKVSQYMQTDLLIVHPNDPVELAADIMSWERIRHLPVEDESGKLVGLVTSRAVLRHFANLPGARTESSSMLPRSESSAMLPRSDSSTSLLADLTRLGSTPPPANVTVGEVMKRDLVTVSPETSTLAAIALMRRHRIGCLPVVKDGRIVAMVMEEDFMGIAADLLEEKLGALESTEEPSARSATREKTTEPTAQAEDARR